MADVTIRKADPKKAHKRTAAQKLHDAILIAELKLKQWTEHEITAEVNRRADGAYTLTRSQIHQDIEKLEDEWRARAAVKIDLLKGRQLAALDYAEKELWAAWERSKGEQISRSLSVDKAITPEGAQDPEVPEGDKILPKTKSGGRSTNKVNRKNGLGVPNFIALILQIHDRRAKLLGLDAAIKHEHSGPEGKPLDPGGHSFTLVLAGNHANPYTAPPAGG